MNKATAGQPLSISARDWNDCLDAAAWVKRLKATHAPPKSSHVPESGCSIRIRNDTAGDRLPGEIVSLSGFLLTSVERESLWQSGGVPVTGAEPFGVLTFPLPDGEIGECQVVGICRALVDNDDQQLYARPSAGLSNLVGSDSGPVRILYSPAGTGAKMCLVALTDAPTAFIGLTGSGGIPARSGLVVGRADVMVLWVNGDTLTILRDENDDPLLWSVINIIEAAVDAYAIIQSTREHPSQQYTVTLVPCSVSSSGGSITSPPTVVNVSAMEDSGSYATDDILSPTVQFDQSVTVTGTPRLQLEVGGATVYATYIGGTGSTTLTFTYTVGSSDTSADLDYVATDSLDLNGGTIRNTFGLDADLTLPAPGEDHSLGDNENLKINQPPAIVTITSPDDDTTIYVTSDVVTITVEFDGSVTVSGTPELSLDSGGTATYASGSGTNTLTFTYTVGSGDSSNDLSVSSVDLPGGATIQSAGGLDADLTLPTGENLDDNKTLRVNPTVSNTGLHWAGNANGFGNWSNESNAEGVNDGSKASTSGSDSIALTDYLFTLPGGSIVVGVEVTINVDGDTSDSEVWLYSNGSLGDNKAGEGGGLGGTYGDSSDVWGNTGGQLSVAVVNSSTFGVSFRPTAGTATNLDSVSIKIFYV